MVERVAGCRLQVASYRLQVEKGKIEGGVRKPGGENSLAIKVTNVLSTINRWDTCSRQVSSEA